ncbi:MAG: hypothetical protein HC837_21350 [Chloroflexaceae bacterium]|nr:hypothetical protein [Chloroflexaceae bacterium]
MGNLGANVTTADGISAVSWGDNRIDCFARREGSMELVHRFWNGKQWSSWHTLGGVLNSAPCAVSRGPNQINCFALGSNGQLFHIYWNDHKWSGWENLGGEDLQSAPAAVAVNANHIECFVRSTDSNLWHLSWK